MHPMTLSTVLALGVVSTACSGASRFASLASVQCESRDTPIHDIQGTDEVSPLEGQAVTTHGVVVGDYQGASGLQGFFLQSEDADFDDDAHTSEGLFVYQKDEFVDVSAGDLVSVSGTVSEYQGLTELSDVLEVRVCGRGASAASTVARLPPSSDLELESLEGMRVTFPQALFVADTNDLGHYGEVTVSSAARLWQPTAVVSPGRDAKALQLDNARTKVRLDDGSSSAYPQSLPLLGLDGTLRLGDSVQGLTGILGYAFGNYVIYPVTDAPPQFSRDNGRPDAPPRSDSTLRVVSFNLDNYFTTLNTGSPQCGPNGDLDCRGANTLSEFVRQRTKIVSALSQLEPDIVALMEIENDAKNSIQSLVDGLNGILGEGTFAYIDTGILGTDAIKVGLIYNPNVVSPMGHYAVLDSSVDPDFLDKLNRPVLAQTFVRRIDGEVLTVVVNHLKSKSTSCPGDPDVGDGQGPCNLARMAAIRAEIGWLSTDPTDSGDSDTLLVGDFNAYTKEDPIALLVASGYTNLTERFLGSTAYSYVFAGQSGALDHAFASSSLVPQVVRVDEWHINADEPNFLDYNQEHDPDQSYQPNPYRSSDHDPLVVSLALGVSTSR